jgi:hypothetical protein
LIKPTDEGGLGWGTLWGSLALFAVLAVLVTYQAIQVRRHPLDPLPYPVNRHTGEPQQPNGAVVTWTPDSSRTTRAPEGHVSEPAKRES